jgi:spore germination protein
MFKKRSLLAIIVAVIVTGSVTFGTVMYNENRLYRNYLQAQFQRSLYNLITDVENMQVALSKTSVTASPKQSLLLFGEISREASTAQERLNALPIAHNAVAQTSKFLAQVGDFSYALLKSNNRGEGLSDGDWTNVEKLRDFAGYLTIQLQDLENEIAAGNINWGEVKNERLQFIEKDLNSPMDIKFENISEQMQEYPTLIYDGPFAENVLNIKPKILSEEEISLDKAKEIATELVGKDEVQSISLYSDKSGGSIPVYALSVDIKGREEGNVNIDISKNGGKPVYMLDSREVSKGKISVKEAINIGKKYLEKNGYKDMIPSFSLRYDNVAVINYIYVQDKVVIYPDQIKLKVALDNGDIVGIESQHYLTAHTSRTIQKPRITSDEARKNVSQRLEVKNIRLTIIPMESRREVFCYEFYGKHNGEDYIVYINAMDGTEERILKVLETPNGELTM